MQPLFINQERVCVIDGKPVNATIIDFGNKIKCKSTLNIFLASKASKITESEEKCSECKELKANIETLNRQIEELKSQNRTLLKKCDIYKQNNDKYLALINFIDDQKEGPLEDSSHLIDSTKLVAIDLAHPNVCISKAQMNLLLALKTSGAAARALMDFLFENEAYEGKNCSNLEKEYPDKIGAIKNYCCEKFKIDKSKITKAITGKCHGT